MSELTPGPDARAGRRGRIGAAVVMGLPLLIMATSALILPAGLAYSLILRGVREHHTSWLALGIITMGIWLLMMLATARKLGRERRSKN